MRDAQAKGRLVPPPPMRHGRLQPSKCGSGNLAARLTEDDVLQIRKMHIPQKVGAETIARSFPQVSVGAIRAVLEGVSWRHLPIDKKNPKDFCFSKFRGVSWCKRQLQWVAYIQGQGHKRHLGYFSVEEDAARAYDAKARELFGEFAKTNF